MPALSLVAATRFLPLLAVVMCFGADCLASPTTLALRATSWPPVSCWAVKLALSRWAEDFVAEAKYGRALLRGVSLVGGQGESEKVKQEVTAGKGEKVVVVRV